MQKEVIDKANKIMELIERNKKAVEFLKEYADSGVKFGKAKIGAWMYPETTYIDFEPWEVRLMIHNKQQRIKALEKQLEEL